MAEQRKTVLTAISKNAPLRVDKGNHNGSLPSTLLSTFGLEVLSDIVLRTLIPDSSFQAFKKAAVEGHPLDPNIADQIANAMKEWAISKGATHFTHWFSPMTGATGEKHDSFLKFSQRDAQYILDFSGRELIRGEPDASSFPSGGIRATFEARGYTIWDMSSPPFIRRGPNGATLFIPTAFCSWTGEALDTKTPLLRSEEVLNKQAVRLIKLLGDNTIKSVRSTLGPEQEFFLIDRGYYCARPDLVMLGRTVIGAPPPKGQETEYHYMGRIAQRVLACLQEVETELWKLGIPVKTRHNEVAPNQYEMAPIYEHSAAAADHNMLMMDVLREVAEKHGLTCLLHEKPFSYINGSGKHINWSLETDKRENLFDPGSTPIENARFMLFLTAIIRAIHLHGDLIRGVIAIPGNTYRLGASEAPPVIISVYLGEELDDVCQTLMGKPPRDKGDKLRELRLGVTSLPTLPRDSSDRNRTSPFAFTGNKFEFRAVGSSQPPAEPVTVLNTITAESLQYLCDEIEKKMKSGASRTDAIDQVIRETLKKHYAIVFNGNGYLESWHAEAAQRGLPILRTAPAALAVWDAPKNVELFDRLGVLTPKELAARSSIMHEKFFEHILIEAKCIIELATTYVLPATMKFQQQVANSIASAALVLKNDDLFTQQRELLSKVTTLINKLLVEINRSKKIVHKAEEDKAPSAQKQLADHHDALLDIMPRLRSLCDELEQTVDDSLWPLPKYSEMLFF